VHRREFFDNVAQDLGFDSTNVQAWYSNASPGTVMKYKGGAAVLGYHNGSFVQALIELYPELPFDEKKFLNPSGCEYMISSRCSCWPRFTTAFGNWVGPEFRREFFDKLAEDKGFSPLDPSGWYTKVGTRDVVTRKVHSRQKDSNEVS
jgi:hypothetical protein